eukprot:scaffold1878_cov258-Pinguiococcus_pyrenoidosus.AAC.16
MSSGGESKWGSKPSINPCRVPPRCEASTCISTGVASAQPMSPSRKSQAATISSLRPEAPLISTEAIAAQTSAVGSPIPKSCEQLKMLEKSPHRGLFAQPALAHDGPPSPHGITACRLSWPATPHAIVTIG